MVLHGILSPRTARGLQSRCYQQYPTASVMSDHGRFGLAPSVMCPASLMTSPWLTRDPQYSTSPRITKPGTFSWTGKIPTTSSVLDDALSKVDVIRGLRSQVPVVVSPGQVESRNRSRPAGSSTRNQQSSVAPVRHPDFR